MGLVGLTWDLLVLIWNLTEDFIAKTSDFRLAKHDFVPPLEKVNEKS